MNVLRLLGRLFPETDADIYGWGYTSDKRATGQDAREDAVAGRCPRCGKLCGSETEVHRHWKQHHASM